MILLYLGGDGKIIIRYCDTYEIYQNCVKIYEAMFLLSVAYFTGVVQVGEGDKGDADAAGLGALLLCLEGLNEGFGRC